MARPRSFDRDAALEQAMLHFWANGYEQTSISDLTQAMGIAAPSLYAAFGDKRRLFDEAVARYQASPNGPVRRALKEPTAYGAVATMLRSAAVEYTIPDLPNGCFIMSEPCLEQERAASDAGLRARMRQGVKDGELPPHTEPDALAAFYGAVMSGMSARSRDGASRAELLAIADTALAAWPGTAPD